MSLTTACWAVVLNKTVYQVHKVGNLEITVLSYVPIVSLLPHCMVFSVITYKVFFISWIVPSKSCFSFFITALSLLFVYVFSFINLRMLMCCGESRY